MKPMRDLKVVCATTTGRSQDDHLLLETMTTDGTICVQPDGCVYLNEAKARRLAAWLLEACGDTPAQSSGPEVI